MPARQTSSPARRSVRWLSSLTLLCVLMAACDCTVPLDKGYRLIRTGGGGRLVLATPEGPETHVIEGPSVSGYLALQPPPPKLDHRLRLEALVGLWASSNR